MATWSYLQGNGSAESSGFAYSSNVTAGSLLIVGLAGDRGTSTDPPIPTDTRGTTYAVLGSGDDTTNGVFARWWYGIAPSSGANSIDLTNMLNFDAYICGEWAVDSGTITLTSAATGKVANHTNATDNIASNLVTGSEIEIGLNVETGADVVISAGTFFNKRAETNLEGFTGNPVTFEDDIGVGNLTKASYTGNASGRGIVFAASFAAGGAPPGPQDIFIVPRWVW